MKREINMKKTLLFSAMVFAALALCSCGSAETPSASGPAYAPAASSGPVDEISEQTYNNGEYEQDPSPIHSLDLDKAWTFSEEVEGDSYATTIAFFEDESLYGMYYIPDSGFSLSMRGTYAINGNILTLDVYWSDADPPPVSYEMKINSTDSIPGFYLTVVSEDAMYYRHQHGDRFLFREDENMNAQECRDKCLQLWDMEPQ